MSAREIPDSIWLSIVTTIAEKEGVDPLDLEPLHSTVDTDALRNLLNGNANQYLQIKFQYHGYEVTAASDGQVTVERLA